MGDDPNAIQGARSLTNGTGLGDLAGGGEDGSFEGFLSALRNGRIASALRQGTNDGDADNDGAPTPPLNFYRMFRFGPSSTTPETPREGEGGENDEPRLVPIIIVGIRSVPQGSGANGGNLNEDLPPFINALSNFPTPLAANALDMHDGHSIDALLSPPQNASSFRARRRASM
ncbi:uncharacterized protein K489DRAFT_299632, partial [Dissoconium aciculare CBS 342.82]|uniref:Uncharacterized protein n=1 Tax=Dissoconium aciculare CBS 342.82 TaxID=1314786 RepID=A0A6J3LUL5_9PEZI